MSPDDYLNLAVKRLAAADPSLHPKAYFFVNDAVAYTALNLGRNGQGPQAHLSGQELSLGIRDFALEHFGSFSLAVLQHWGIHSTLDFGRIVFALIGMKVLGASPDDRLEDFLDVFDFATTFASPSSPDLQVPQAWQALDRRVFQQA